MERGFLSQKGSGDGRGVKEKNKDVVAKDGISPSVSDELVVKEKQSSLVDTSIPMKCHVVNTPCVGPNPPPPTQEENAPAGNALDTATCKPSGKMVNVRTLYTPMGNGIDVVVSVDSIRAISERFANTTYGFFLGNKVAYLVVANYVRNTWGKYGLIRSMFSSSIGLFSFQFSSIDGLDAMLENGPWFIQNNPLILKKWHPNKNILKEDVSAVPVWVKLHGVPVTSFSEDGLSVIANKLGTPLMLDSYTSDMCMQSWGMSSYARVMIELQVDVELKDNIVMAMPKIIREGHYTCNVRVEYEWKPPSGNKKKGVEPTIEVNNLNPFEVLNSVDNDVEFGTNGGTTNLVNNRATSSGSSFMNIDNDGEFASNTPIGIVESDSEVKVVFNETANLRIFNEWGFLDSGDKKKKKEGVSSTPSDEFPVLSGIAKNVKNIKGKRNVPKSILKKAVRNIVNDTHEVVKPSHDGGSASKVSFEAVGASAKSSTTVDDATNFSPKSGGSFANLLKPNDTTNKIHFRTLVNDERVKYRKFGFEMITRNDDGVYLFKFATKSGRDQVIDKGPWMICKSPIMLSKWSPSVSLKKGEGRISFARALIEIDAAAGLKKEVSMAILVEEGDGHIKEVVRVEYEWMPPHCVDCIRFGHDTSLCPKRVCEEEVPNISAWDTKATIMEEKDDGFKEVKSRKKKKGADS
nr:hypothetical protein [Tanacetum cinerariifolium]